MPIVATQAILHRAVAGQYAVAAFNVINDLTMRAVLEAAESLRAPVIIQTSMATVRSLGYDTAYCLFRSMAKHASVPAALQLDHCTDLAMAEVCLRRGWNSVLFDASALSFADAIQQTKQVVRLAHVHGAAVEGEVEAIMGSEDGVEMSGPPGALTLEASVEFVLDSGIDAFAPSIGIVHGTYRRPPKLDERRVAELSRLTGKPIVLHGGSGLGAADLRQLIRHGCAKVNVSSALNEAFVEAIQQYSRETPVVAATPHALLGEASERVMESASAYIRRLGSTDKAPAVPE